ncbi:hypothetical protein D3C72_1733800 [compost metagenome]
MGRTAGHRACRNSQSPPGLAQHGHAGIGAQSAEPPCDPRRHADRGRREKVGGRVREKTAIGLCAPAWPGVEKRTGTSNGRPHAERDGTGHDQSSARQPGAPAKGRAQ